jgi:large subunit ribosomal protein L23
MELSIYSVIRGPRTTIKSYELNQRFQKLVLDVHPQATKPAIAEALKKLFNVEVDNVRIIVMKGKARLVSRRQVVGKLRKKAIVTLKRGHSINLGVDAPVAYASGGSKTHDDK